MAIQTGLQAIDNGVGWQFDNTYSRLPKVLFSPVTPATFRAPKLSILNLKLAEELGLNFDALSLQC
jgi:serine/tyrosine/threonine adenylyltransferase